MKLLETITGGYTSSAKVVGDALVLSLPDAQSPVVWRMDLADIKAAAFEINEKDGTFVLMMKTAKGDKQDIAPFDHKAKALRALMAASHAMEQASTVGKSAANDAAVAAVAPQPKGKGSLATGIIAVIILIVLIFGLIQVSPKSPQLMTNTAASGSSSGFGGNAASRPGVPVSADEFLKAH